MKQFKQYCPKCENVLTRMWDKQNVRLSYCRACNVFYTLDREVTIEPDGSLRDKKTGEIIYQERSEK